MKLTQNKFILLLALGGLALTASVAKATVTYADDDLMLGFRDSSGTITNALLLDIGKAGFWRDQTTNILNIGTISYTPSGSLVIGNLATDLASAFGGTWATNTNITWGIVGHVASSLGKKYPLSGGTLDIQDTLYGSKGEAVFGTVTTPYGTQASGTQATPGAAIDTMGGVFNNNTIGWTAGNSVAAIIEPTSGNTVNYASNAATGFGGYFTGLEASFAGASGSGGLSTSALDLFRLVPSSGTGTYEGTFTLSSSGNLSFTAPAAAPEPSRAVLTILGACFLSLRRRRARIA